MVRGGNHAYRQLAARALACGEIDDERFQHALGFYV